MRSYKLIATHDGTEWDLSPYGDTPIFMTNRSISTDPNYAKSDNWNFDKTGESPTVQKLGCRIIIKDSTTKKAEQRYRELVEFIAKNSRGLVRRAMSDSNTLGLPTTGRSNEVYGLELHSIKNDLPTEQNRDRYCYVTLSQISGKTNNGGDIDVQITFNMESLWIEKKVYTTNLGAMTSSGSGTTTIAIANTGDVPTPINVEFFGNLLAMTITKDRDHASAGQVKFVIPSTQYAKVNNYYHFFYGRFANVAMCGYHIESSMRDIVQTRAVYRSAYQFLSYDNQYSKSELYLDSGESVYTNVYTSIGGISGATGNQKLNIIIYNQFFTE